MGTNVETSKGREKVRGPTFRVLNAFPTGSIEPGQLLGGRESAEVAASSHFAGNAAEFKRRLFA